jgi:hypothetical protein
LKLSQSQVVISRLHFDPQQFHFKLSRFTLDLSWIVLTHSPYHLELLLYKVISAQKEETALFGQPLNLVQKTYDIVFNLAVF